jgi:hypothetical protein
LFAAADFAIIGAAAGAAIGTAIAAMTTPSEATDSAAKPKLRAGHGCPQEHARKGITVIGVVKPAVQRRQ